MLDIFEPVSIDNSIYAELVVLTASEDVHLLRNCTVEISESSDPESWVSTDLIWGIFYV